MTQREGGFPLSVQYSHPLPITEIKAANDGTWEVSGYVSTFGNVDRGGDVIMAGAFDEALSDGRRVKFLFAHDQSQVLGVPISLKSDETGLLGKFKISRTRLGEDVHTLLKDGALDSFSIGYFPDEFDFDPETGTRLLKKIDLLEASVVAVPMNPEAVVTNVKHQEGVDSKATWTAAYINSLPDSSFAVILPGGEKDSEGKTTPRSLRKLPHHNADGGLDLPHLRAALSREPRTNMPDGMHSRARGHLARHAAAEGIGKALVADHGHEMTMDEESSLVVAVLASFVERCQDIVTVRAADERRPGAPFFERLTTVRAAVDELLSLKAAPATKQDEAPPPATDAPRSELSTRIALRRAKLRRAGILEHAS